MAEEIIDLTFSESDTEAPPARRAPAAAAPPDAAMRTPLRRLLSMRDGGTDDAQPSQQSPSSPETIELLDSPEPARAMPPREPARPSNPAPPPGPRPRRTSAVAAAAVLRRDPLPFDDDDEEYDAAAAAVNGGTAVAADREWRPAPAPAPAPAAGRKPKRTREEIAAAAAERKQREAAEKAARKAERQYNSDRHVLRYLSVVLDQRLMTQPLGLGIASAFQATQATDKPEHEQIRYTVEDTGLGAAGLCAAKWVRKVPTAFSSSQAPSASQLARETASQGAGALDLVDEEEPHVLVCFEGEAFAAAVLRDGLAAVFAAFASDCPEHRPHFLVHRLDQYLTRREREDYNRTLGRGGAGANGTADPSQAFNRRSIDDFVHRMAVEAPHVCFRDVSTAEEGADHVVSLTKAIAQRVTAPGGAARYLAAQGRGKRGGSAALTAVLASHPVQSAPTRAAMSALCTLPSVGPQVAHAVASRYQSLGALMEMLFDRGRSDAEKVSELENLQRPGGSEGRRTRVGPKAARQLLALLTSDDPDILVRE